MTNLLQKIKKQKSGKKPTLIITTAIVVLAGFGLFNLSVAFGATFTLGTDADQTINVHNDLTIGDGTNAGTVTGATYNPILDIAGDVTITGSSTLIAATSSAFTIAGNWSNSGTFTHSSGTTTFDGTGTSTISGATTFYNLSSITPSKILEFTAGTTSTTTVAGNLTLDGDACETQIKLRSTSISSYWYFNVLGSASVDYVDVQDSNATGSASAIVATNSTDSENNENWSITLGFCGIPITASGTVYSNEGADPIVEPKTVRIKVNGAGSYATTTASDGTYYIDTVFIGSEGDVITAYIDGADENAVTVTRATSTTANIGGLDLYQNRIIVRHEDAGPLTIDDLAYYDYDDDPDDILFTAASSTDTLTASSTSEFFVWSGDTFSTGGAGGAVSLADVDIRGTFTAISTQTISVSGNWEATSAAVFNAASSNVMLYNTGNFGGTASFTFYDLTFGDGSAGATTAVTTATATVSHLLTIVANQTLNAGSSKIWELSGGGTPFVINGTFNYNTSTFKYTANADTYITDTDYYHLELKPDG